MLLQEIVDVRSRSIQSYAELRSKLFDVLGPQAIRGLDRDAATARAHELLRNATFLDDRLKAKLTADVIEQLYTHETQ